MNDEDLCFLSLADVSGLISKRELSPVALVRTVLERIAKLDGALGTYVTLMADTALEAASEAEREIGGGNYRGPLHGVPVSLKDIIYVKGVRNTGSSRVLADFVPDYDAAVTKKLRASGAIIIGKTQLWELAMLSESPSYFPPAHNPWNLERATMGSSSGSAAGVAAGLSYTSIGSDTGGSIRGPASACGVVGLKPTYGRVSRYGVTPVSWTLDHVGPLTRTVTDAALVMNAIAGFDPMDITSLDTPVPDYTRALGGRIRGLRIGVPDHLFGGIDPDFEPAIRQALAVLESAGATVQSVVIPAVEQAQIAQSIINSAESASVYEERIRADASLFGQNARTRTELGSLILATDYLKAQRIRTVFRRSFLSAMDQFDVLITPTSPAPPPRLDEEPEPWDWRQGSRTPPNRFRWPFNLVGAPSISIPCGLTTDGLPIGMQISGRPTGDEVVLKVAHAYEQLTEWHKMRPPPATDSTRVSKVNADRRR